MESKTDSNSRSSQSLRLSQATCLLLTLAGFVFACGKKKSPDATTLGNAGVVLCSSTLPSGPYDSFSGQGTFSFDASGNAYVLLNVGVGGCGYTMVRQELAGGTTWSNVLSNNDRPTFWMANDSSGNIFRSELGIVPGAINGSVLFELPANKSAWQQLTAPSTYTGNTLNVIAVDSSNTIWVGGEGPPDRTSESVDVDYSGGSWLVWQQSAPNGTWTLADQFTYEGAMFNQPQSIVTTSGAIYVGGECADTFEDFESINGTWVVRKSSDNGKTWSTIDTLKGQFHSMAADSKGNLFVFGYDTSKDNETNNSAIRITKDGGLTWTQASVPVSISPEPQSKLIAVDSSDNIFLTGGNANWQVLKSSDQGNTWTVKDSFTSGLPEMLGISPSGTIFAGAVVSGHWTVRQSSDGGSTWTTTDDVP
jgi:hypothetical protein